MLKLATIPSLRFVPAITFTTLALAVALSGYASGATAQQHQETPVIAADPASLTGASLADLEHVFWACDYTASAFGPAHVDVDLCQGTYDALKQRKFGGEFERLLAWWEHNKPVQHERMRTIIVMQ